MTGHPRVGVRLLIASVLLAAGLSACGSDDEDTSPGSTSTPSTTSAPASSGTAPEVAPTTAVTPTSSEATEGQTGEGLDDGEHVVFIDSIDEAAATMTVDLVELLTGQAAMDAYLEDTGETLDGEAVYLRNRNDKLRALAVDAAAGPFSIIDAETCCEPIEVGFAGLTAVWAGGFADGIGSDPPFTISVRDDTITSAVQLYMP